MVEPPLFPNSIGYVREQRRLTQRQLADAVNTSVDRLARFEQGSATPTLRQFATLQAVLGVPDYELADDAQPDVPMVLADLRQPSKPTMAISPKGLKAYFSRSAVAGAIQHIAASLQMRPPKHRPNGIGKKNLLQKIPELQSLMDFDPADARWVQDVESAWRYARIKIEEFGVYCLLADAPPTDYRGLYTRIDADTGLIIVNKKTFRTKARLFTLLHEFGHFLINVEGLSDPLIVNNEEERICNEFASHFLLSDESLALFLREAPSSGEPNQKISLISNKCLLSKGAVAYRLMSSGEIEKAEYQRWLADNQMPQDYGGEDVHSDDEDEDDSGGGHYAYTVASDFGFWPIQVLKRAMDQHAIDDVHVAKLLNARGATQEKVFKTVADRLKALGL